MRKTLPQSTVVPGHPDFETLKTIADEICHRAGGLEKFRDTVPLLLREAIDDVIDTPRTGRRSYDDLEKTEKTYIGTKVEIVLRALIKVPKGRLDTVVAGFDVDIKHTMGNNWMIPVEAVNQPCILVAADEDQAKCSLGLIVAQIEYLTAGKNRDSKRSVSKVGFENILWLILDEPYPRNFWNTIPPDAVDRIFSEDTGNGRVVALFREVQNRPLTRDIINDVARQKDFMRRIRADGGRGTRDRLAHEGIVILSGSYDKELIEKLGLPTCGKSDFISRSIKTEQERQLAGDFGFSIP